MNLSNYGQYKEDIFIKLDFDFVPRKKILDIGCGDGATLQEMKDRWRKVAWFEFGSNKKEHDISYAPSLPECDFEGQTFDVILLKHVFEHIDDPRGYLQTIKKLSHHKTRVMIILPSVGWWSSKLWWKYAAERDIPRHLYNYTPSTMSRLLEEEWFMINNHQMMENYGWWISMQRRAKNTLWGELSWWRKWFLGFAFMFDIITSLTQHTNQMWFICSPK